MLSDEEISACAENYCLGDAIYFRGNSVHDFARAVIAANEAKRWRPIAEAPKDGTTVLLGRHMGNFGFVRGYGRFEGDPKDFVSGWISYGLDALQGLGLAHPTHFMPLPEPPEKQK